MWKSVDILYGAPVLSTCEGEARISVKIPAYMYGNEEDMDHNTLLLWTRRFVVITPEQKSWTPPKRQ